MELSKFAYITAIGTLADSLISLISLITVSKLSTVAIAATGIVSYLFFLINAASMVFTGGLMVLISQAFVTQNTDMYGRVMISYAIWRSSGRRLMKRVF